MTTNMYAIYDEKAESYNAPFPLATDGLAIRAFEAACNDSRTDLYKYVGDYKLYCIGTFDDNAGVLSATIPARYIMTNTRAKSTEEEIAEIEEKIDEIQD